MYIDTGDDLPKGGSGSDVRGRLGVATERGRDCALDRDANINNIVCISQMYQVLKF